MSEVSQAAREAMRQLRGTPRQVAPVTLRQAVVDAVDVAAGTLTARVGGSTVAVAGVRYVGPPPAATQAVWVLANGPDYLALPARGVDLGWFTTADGTGNFSVYPATGDVRLQWNVEPSIRALNRAGTAYVPMRASAFTVTSDPDVKEDVQPLEGGCEEYVNPAGVFTYRLPGEQRRRVGMTADQLTELVVDEVDGHRMVDTYGALGLLWNSVQGHHRQTHALQDRVETLEQQVSDLQTATAALEQRVAAIEKGRP